MCKYCVHTKSPNQYPPANDGGKGEKQREEKEGRRSKQFFYRCLNFVQLPLSFPNLGTAGVVWNNKLCLVSRWWLAWLNTGNNTAGDLGKSCQGTGISRDGIVRTGGFG